MKHKIVLVPFPFADISMTKVRPAVCLTDKTGKHDYVIIAFITSRNPKDKVASDIELESSDETGLKVSSFIRLHRIIAVPAQLIRRELGILPRSKERELKESSAVFLTFEMHGGSRF